MYGLVYLCVFVFCFIKIGNGDYLPYEDIEGSVKLHQSPASWRDARIKCHEEGGVLASPETEELLSAMTAAMSASSPPPRVFTGIHDTYSKGSFHSLQGTPLARIPTKLMLGQSDTDRAESCLVMHPDGTLVKNNCGDTLPYVCYKREHTCGSKYNGYKYDTRTGSCYKVHDEKLSWTRAFDSCAAEDAYLVVINSWTEAEVLVELLKAEKQANPGGVAHVGFRDWKDNNLLWMTVDGKTLQQSGYQNWTENEPDHPDSQHCGAIYYHGGLDNVSCDSQNYAFICERKPESSKRERILEHMESCPKNREPLCIVC